MAYNTEVSLLDSATYTANATKADGSQVAVDTYRRGTFILDVTALSGSTTLDVAIQTYINGNWTDIARFAQVTATGARVLWDVGGDTNTSSTIEEAIQDLNITVSTKRAGPWGQYIRATYTIASVTSITFSLKGFCQG